MKKILFICEYNACRSQMAEGLAHKYLTGTHQIFSAGLYPGSLHETTVSVMHEVGVDITSQRSKMLKEILHESFDLMVLLAQETVEATHAIQAKEKMHWFFPDPAKAPGDREDILQAMRSVRDELEIKIKGLSHEKSL